MSILKNLIRSGIFLFILFLPSSEQWIAQAQDPGIVSGVSGTNQNTYLAAQNIFNQPYQGFVPGQGVSSNYSMSPAMAGVIGGLNSLGLASGTGNMQSAMSGYQGVSTCGLDAAMLMTDSGYEALLKATQKSANKVKKATTDEKMSSDKTSTAGVPSKDFSNCDVSPSFDDVGTSCIDYLNPEGRTEAQSGQAYQPEKIYSIKQTDYDTNKKSLGDILDFYKWKAKNCGSKDLDKLEKLKTALNCELTNLANAVGEIGNFSKNSFNQNQQNYQEMVALEADMDQQIAHTQELLNGDGATGKKGFNQLKKELQELRDKALFKNETAYKQAKAQIDVATKRLTLDLVTRKNQNLNSCLMSDTANEGVTSKVMTCLRAKVRSVPGAQGGASSSEVVRNQQGRMELENVPCGPLEFALNSDARKIFMSSDGKFVDTQTRRDQFFTAVSVYQRAMANLSTQMATQDATGANVATQLSSPDAINRALESQLSRTITNNGRSYRVSDATRSNLNKLVRSCFKVAERNVSNYQKGPDYQGKVEEIENQKRSLISQMQEAVGQFDSIYGDALFLMTGSTRAKPRAGEACLKANYSTLDNCHETLKRELMAANNGRLFGSRENLLPIPKGAKIGGFGIRCNNVEECAANLQRFKAEHDSRKRQVVSSRRDWVQKGNAKITQELTQLAKGLHVRQRAIKNGYNKLKQILGSMGVTGVPESIKPLSTKKLEQMDGPNGEKGPFISPDSKEMPEVISGFSPEPLPDFTDTGIQEALDKAVEKAAEKKKEMQKEAEDVSKKLAELNKLDGELQNACGQGCIKGKTCSESSTAGSGSGSANISNSAVPQACVNCNLLMNACSTEITTDSGPTDNPFTVVLQALDNASISKSKATIAQLNSKLGGVFMPYSGLLCSQMKEEYGFDFKDCTACVSNLSGSYNTDTDGSGTNNGLKATDPNKD